MVEQNIMGLPQLIEQLDQLVLQHLNYVRNLEIACENHASFVHKQCTECNFGKLLYAQVFPVRHTYPDVVRKLIEEIEQEHKIFHQFAATIDPFSPPKEQIDFTGVCMLVLKLYKLDHESKKLLPGNLN